MIGGRCFVHGVCGIIFLTWKRVKFSGKISAVCEAVHENLCIDCFSQ